jgi:hypothetical protein
MSVVGTGDSRPPESLQQQGRQRLYLHVGLPKSGTTFLQGLMANNRTRLKQRGFIYPFIRRETMFHTAVELRGQHERWGLPPEKIDGTWQLVLGRIRSFGGVGIVSHELLAAATPEQVARVARDTEEFELHVVVTARDLSRQATALWQEEVKNGRRWSFEEFSRSLFGGDGEQLGDSGFWRSQNLASVLARWAVVVPPDRMHVVVVPRSSGDPLELWRRFADAVGLDPESLDLELQPRVNESLGAAQVALLRRVVTALDGRLGQPHYAHVVKRFFAQTQLSRISSPRPVTPPELRDRLDRVARQWVQVIEDKRYAVHGDLVELVPGAGPTPEGTAHPDEITAEELLHGMPEVIAEMLVEIAVLRGQIPGRKALPALQRTEDGRLEPVPAVPPAEAGRSQEAGPPALNGPTGSDAGHDAEPLSTEPRDGVPRG